MTGTLHGAIYGVVPVPHHPDTRPSTPASAQPVLASVPNGFNYLFYKPRTATKGHEGGNRKHSSEAPAALAIDLEQNRQHREECRPEPHAGSIHVRDDLEDSNESRTRLHY